MFSVIILACVVLVEGLPPYIEAEAKFEKKPSTGGLEIDGRIIFSDTHDGKRSAKVSLSRRDGLLSDIDWIIHDSPCSSLQQLYPSITPPNALLNPTVYSGGMLTSAIGQIENKNFSDTGLELLVSTGIVGRSLVLKSKSDASKQLCSDILWKGPELSQTLTKFVYPSGAISSKPIFGYVSMIHPIAKKESEYPIILYVGFRYGPENNISTSPASNNHDWHIHTKYIDRTTGLSDCLYTTAIIGREVNAQLCSSTNPSQCAMGDMGEKFGHISIPGQYVFTDATLEFIHINGQNFVLHQSDNGAPREACQLLNTTETFVKKADWSMSDDSPDASSNAGAIAGAVIGGLFGFCCLVVLVVCIVKNIDCAPREKGKKMGATKSSMGMQKVEKNPEYVPDAQAPAKGAVLEDGKWRAVS